VCPRLRLGLTCLDSTRKSNENERRRQCNGHWLIAEGDEAGEYAITGEDGKRYGLRSKSVDLSKHVGYQVTVTGTKMREENEEKEKKEAGGGEYADLRVTNVKHISETCK
jgi:hypothetical protein